MYIWKIDDNYTIYTKISKVNVFVKIRISRFHLTKVVYVIPSISMVNVTAPSLCGCMVITL